MKGNAEDQEQMNVSKIAEEKERLTAASNLLPNRWIIAVGAGLFLGLKSTGFGFEMSPVKFYQLFMETVKYVCLALVVVSIWMTMFRFFVGRFRGELTWFAILMVFLFSTETFASLFISAGKYITGYVMTQTNEQPVNSDMETAIQNMKKKQETINENN